MTMVLIDMALIAIAAVVGASLIQSGRRFVVIFTQLRAEMAQGVAMQSMMVTTRSTTLVSAVDAGVMYQTAAGVAANPAGALAIRLRLRRRPAAMRAAA